jgi:hypothetical protein
MKLRMALFLVFFLNTAEMLAQSDRATLSGTVKDVSGALVADARVVVTNVSTNLQSTATTDPAGRFTFLHLPIGQYAILCSKDGFEEYRRSGLDLEIGQAPEIQIVLVVGVKTEAITVIGNAPLLQSQTSSLSSNLNNAAVSELPLNVQGSDDRRHFGRVADWRVSQRIQSAHGSGPGIPSHERRNYGRGWPHWWRCLPV